MNCFDFEEVKNCERYGSVYFCLQALWGINIHVENGDRTLSEISEYLDSILDEYPAYLKGYTDKYFKAPAEAKKTWAEWNEQGDNGLDALNVYEIENFMHVEPFVETLKYLSDGIRKAAKDGDEGLGLIRQAFNAVSEREAAMAAVWSQTKEEENWTDDESQLNYEDALGDF